MNEPGTYRCESKKEKIKPVIQGESLLKIPESKV